MKSNFNVIVIGSGVAGMTAAIYLKRANMSVAIIESTAPGGQLNRINKLENYPGVIDVDGPTLAFNVFSQMQELSIPYIYGEVLSISDNGLKKVINTNKDSYECSAIIVASGRKPIETGIDNEKTLIGNGISYCCVCDGALYKDKIVGVYTNNEEGINEAKYLSKICKQVFVIGLNKENENNIEYIDGEIKEINEVDGNINSVTVNEKNIFIDGLFILLGSTPATDFIEIEKKEGYIIVDKNMSTKKEGIFACGDVTYKELYQVSTAVGDGATAANGAIRYLDTKGL